jgi:hypothetical protein
MRVDGAKGLWRIEGRGEVTSMEGLTVHTVPKSGDQRQIGNGEQSKVLVPVDSLMAESMNENVRRLGSASHYNQSETRRRK